MYIVNKGFANNDISASKNQVIDIKDKSLATALEEAGFITPYSEDKSSVKELKNTIKSLTEQLKDKDSEIQTLTDKVLELEQTLNMSENNDEHENENLDSDEEKEKKDSNSEEEKESKKDKE